jgi:hypothetical protein
VAATIWRGVACEPFPEVAPCATFGPIKGGSWATLEQDRVATQAIAEQRVAMQATPKRGVARRPHLFFLFFFLFKKNIFLNFKLLGFIYLNFQYIF